MGLPEIRQFMIHLVSDKKVSASTQNQALSAILFLYRHVLHIQLDEANLSEFRPGKTKTVPVVLSKEEVKAVLANLNGVYQLVAQLMYGSGLRVMEALRLRGIQLQNRFLYGTIRPTAVAHGHAPILVVRTKHTRASAVTQKVSGSENCIRIAASIGVLDWM
jgi:site-specific recombinase XerD